MPALESMTVAELLSTIGSKTPAPGGGAVAALTGALAAATAQMVVSFSVGKKSLAAHDEELRRADETLTQTRALFLELAEEDAVAFEALGPLLRLPKEDPRRVAEFPDALDRALQPPRATLAAATNLLRLVDRLTAISNRQLRSDLAIAAVLAEAAAQASDWNVRINLPLVEAEPKRTAYEREARDALRDAKELRERIEAACAV